MVNFRDKIKTLDELEALSRSLKRQGKGIVLGHGVFDLLHPGHMFYLNESKAMGDVLVVSAVADHCVRKGPNRPHYNQDIRVNSLANLECVDYVILCEDFGPWEIIKRVKPDIYARASDVEHLLTDPKSGLTKDKQILDSIGGQIRFVKEVPDMHSTKLLNKYFRIFPPKTVEFLKNFRKKYSTASVVEKIEELKGIRALVIGEAIIDEYCSVHPMGKPNKSNIIAAKFLGSEQYAGGIMACANHLAGVCDDVDMLTYLGATDTKEEFIRSHLKSNINSKFFYCPDEPTIVKKRFIDDMYFSKLFELYYFEERLLPKEIEEDICKYLDRVISDYDLVVVVDYGHGFLTPKLIDIITAKSKFLSVNAQTNSANTGFNYITKYNRVDYVCIDQLEARLAMHDNISSIECVVTGLAKRLKTNKIVVTLGKDGTISLGEDLSFNTIPGFAHKITDPIGAGDAFIAMSSPCAAAQFPIDLVAFVGNVAGSIATGILGNKYPIEKEELFRYVSYLLE